MADNPLAAWLLQQGPSPHGPGEDAPAAATPSGNALTAAPAPGSSGEQDPPPWDLGPEPATPFPRRLLLLAALPWMVVVVLAVALWLPMPGTSAPPGDGSDASTGPVATGHGGERSPASATTEAAAIDDNAMLLQVAALMVRAELHGPAEAGGDAPAEVRYADQAVGIGIERLGDVAVVTVTALVLEGDDRGWDRSRTARYAIALRSGPSGVDPLGGPWALPTPDAPPEPEPVDDESSPDRVLAALEAAGYRQISDLRLSRPAGLDGVLVAAARAVAPGEDAPDAQQVWIRDGPEAAVLGHRP